MTESSQSSGQEQRRTRRGGQILVDALRGNGADLAFCVAGESYLDVLDGFVDVPALRLITCRHEGGAANMAEAYGKLTGRPGIALVTRGPGACNAAIGVHTAMQDSTPMLLLIGQVARDQAEREAFQEIDYRRMFAPLAKWVAQIDDARRIPELIGHAFDVAASGRPGPVVLALPEDMLGDSVAVADRRARGPVTSHPAPADIARLATMLAQAQRPLMIVGGGWDDAGCADIRRFAEAFQLPVCCSFRRQDVMDNRSPCYAGDLGTGPNPKLAPRIAAADLLLVVGARLGEQTTQGYGLLAAPQPAQTLIHSHPAAEELGRVFRPDLAIQSGNAPMAAALAGLAPPAGRPVWADWTEAARADYRRWQEPEPGHFVLDLASVMESLRDSLPDDAILTYDAGNFSTWGQRYLRYGRPGRQLGPTSGAMGYSVPAAVAASLLHPDRTVVSMVGDGGFLMTGQELATAIHAGATPIVLVFDNGMFGTIRMHQERRFPGRTIATTLTNPDFAALARSYGAYAATVTRTADFAPAFEDARASGRAAVLHLQIDPEQITTRARLSELGKA
ncbi:MAG: thiamine pyrophosphate-binding protein [Azospirillaceae bacterium]|nr:thiamine pyrophosphate-binding protein [Azospirillaceae bacterium]